MGIFAETYGNTIRNRILEHILEMDDLDFAIGDMSKELQISKPKCYETINDFVKKEYILKSRIIGKTHLYRLNKENNKVKLFIKSFRECLKLGIEEVMTVHEKKEEYGQKKKDMKFLKKFRENSTMTEKDALRLGREVNKSLAKRYVRKR